MESLRLLSGCKRCEIFERHRNFQFHITQTELKEGMKEGCAICNALYLAVVNIVTPNFWPGSNIGIARGSGEHGPGKSGIKVQIRDIKRFSRQKTEQEFWLYLSEDDHLSDFVSSFFHRHRPHVLQNPLSDQAIALIQTWIQNCTAQHESCRLQPVCPLLPARLVDVGHPDGSQAPQLIDCGPEHWPYVALSHCWGSNPIITTTQAALANRKLGITWSDLPKTFQETIQLVRALGLRYVWIDCLCIVQDDFEDWKREAIKMADVYENAYLTVAAVAAASGADGLSAAPRTPPVQIQIPGRAQPLFARNVPSCYQGMFERNPAQYPPFQTVDSNLAPLFTRAWAYQERVLSRRMLHLGQDELILECKTDLQCESGPDCLESRQSSILSVKRAIYSGFTARGGEYRDYWYQIVESFSACRLTRESDRLPALSGIVRRFAPHLREGDQYLAGIWRKDLPRALLWQRREQASGHLPPHRPKSKYQPPSWSWCAVEGDSVTFSDCRPHSANDTLFEFLDAGTTLAYDDPFGPVTGGFVKLKGTLIPVRTKVVTPQGSIHPECAIEMFDTSWQVLDVTDTCAEADTQGSSWIPRTFLMPGRIAAHSDVTTYLILQQVDGAASRQSFRRIGSLTASHSYEGAQWLQDGQKSVFTII